MNTNDENFSLLVFIARSDAKCLQCKNQFSLLGHTLTYSRMLHIGYAKKPSSVNDLLQQNKKMRYYNSKRPSTQKYEDIGFFVGDLVFLDYTSWSYPGRGTRQFKRSIDKRPKGPYIVNHVRTNVDGPAYYQLKKMNGELLPGRYLASSLHLAKKNHSQRSFRHTTTTT